MERGRHCGRALAFYGLDRPVAAARSPARGRRLLRLPGALQGHARRRRGPRPLLDKPSDLFEVADELAIFHLAGLVVRAQDRAGMDRGDDALRKVRLDQLAALLRDSEVAPEQGLCGGRTEAD